MYTRVKKSFEMKSHYEEGIQHSIKNKELKCEAEAERKKRVEEGHHPFSAELAAAAKNTANFMAGPASASLEKSHSGVLGSLSYNAGYWTTWPICPVPPDKQ